MRRRISVTRRHVEFLFNREERDTVGDIWSDVRADVLHRLEQHAPSLSFELRVQFAEDAAREVDESVDAALYGRW